jgi:hypothetical protein
LDRLDRLDPLIIHWYFAWYFVDLTPTENLFPDPVPLIAA